MSIIKTNQIQRLDGQPVLNTTGSIIQTVVMQSDTKTSLNVTSFTEASSNYRINITPTHADNRIHLTYYILCNAYMATNTLFQFRAEKYTSGSAATITSPIFASSAFLKTCEMIDNPLIFIRGLPGNLWADNLEGIITKVFIIFLTMSTI